MPGPETPTLDTNYEARVYIRGEPVRVYKDRGGDERVAEDDWDYRTHDKNTGHEIARKQHHEGGLTEIEVIPKAEFDEWQRERAAEEAGKLAVEGAVETTEEVEEVIEDEREVRDDSNDIVRKSKYGGWSEDGRFVLTTEPGIVATTLGVTEAAVKAAAEKGLPPDYLQKAKNNRYMARRLQELGISVGATIVDERTAEVSNAAPRPPGGKTIAEISKLSVEERSQYLAVLETYLAPMEAEAKAQEEKEGAEPGSINPILFAPDPILFLEAKGIRKKLEVEDLADRIETDPRSIKKELKRPGVPIVGRQIGRLLLARSMHRKELRERRKKGLGKNHEDGLLRLGISRTKRNLAHVRRFDEDVKVLRNKLSVLNNHEYKGPEKARVRRDLAESIIRTKQTQEALKQKNIHHKDVYTHGPFSKSFSAQVKAKKGNK